MPQPWQAIAQRFCSLSVCRCDKSQFFEAIIEFKELQEIAVNTLNERIISKLATAGTVAAAAVMIIDGESKIVKMVAYCIKYLVDVHNIYELPAHNQIIDILSTCA